jgi:hypothetical protein
MPGTSSKGLALLPAEAALLFSVQSLEEPVVFHALQQ